MGSCVDGESPQKLFEDAILDGHWKQCMNVGGVIDNIYRAHRDKLDMNIVSRITLHNSQQLALNRTERANEVRALQWFVERGCTASFLHKDLARGSIATTFVFGIPACLPNPTNDESRAHHRLIIGSWLNAAHHLAAEEGTCALYLPNVRTPQSRIPLPDALLYMIARRLDIRSLVSFGATCLHARRIARDDMITEPIIESFAVSMARYLETGPKEVLEACRRRHLCSCNDRWLTICGLCTHTVQYFLTQIPDH
jgi:hypothetical protein